MTPEQEAINEVVKAIPATLKKIEERCKKKEWLCRDVTQCVLEMVQPLREFETNDVEDDCDYPEEE